MKFLRGLTCWYFLRTLIAILFPVGSLTSSSSSTTTDTQTPPPNIVFLVVESTDGRTWRRGYQIDVIPLPSIRKLEDLGGLSFYSHYVNAPVCCPSRASFWSGKYPHKIKAWNNYKGLPHEYNDTIFHVLQRNGYQVHLSGKLDYTDGGHSLDERINAWTMYTRFPYDIPSYRPWMEDDSVCRSHGRVLPRQLEPHRDDWKTLNETIRWIRNHTAAASASSETRQPPFFVYQGMNIVHPAYVTNEHWYSQIDPSKVRVPTWPGLEHVHPCDLQSIMLKGCLPLHANETDDYYSVERRRNIRRIYYAMIAEFDSMVGAYMQAVKDAGVWDNTVFIVTSDHGDMQMEHQQHYKQVPYDASSSVPLVIYDPRRGNRATTSSHPKNRVLQSPTQHVDLFPTILELAGLQDKIPSDVVDGHSLVNFFDDSTEMTSMRSLRQKRRDFVVSQYHGANIAMSWFLIVQEWPCFGEYGRQCKMKLVIWGTGREVDDQLFDLTNDPDETISLIDSPDYHEMARTLKENLRRIVDYPQVAQDVARYNRYMFRDWRDKNPDWKDLLSSPKRRWHASWEAGGQGAWDAIDEWLSNPDDEVLACRKEMVWPVIVRTMDMVT